jgi:L-ribulose-5-phosphate 3-epimerase UlaE
MKNEKMLSQIISESLIPYFLKDSTVVYKDPNLGQGVVKFVQPFLANKYENKEKGYSIHILTDDGVNHTIDVINHSKVFHYLQNEKDAHFDKLIKFYIN